MSGIVHFRNNIKYTLSAQVRFVVCCLNKSHTLPSTELMLRSIRDEKNMRLSLGEKEHHFHDGITHNWPLMDAVEANIEEAEGRRAALTGCEPPPIISIRKFCLGVLIKTGLRTLVLGNRNRDIKCRGGIDEKLKGCRGRYREEFDFVESLDGVNISTSYLLWTLAKTVICEYEHLPTRLWLAAKFVYYNLKRILLYRNHQY